MVFDNWDDGQPNNDVHGNDPGILDEDAVAISSNGFTALWHDYPINEQFEFVCLQTEYIAAPGLS